MATQRGDEWRHAVDGRIRHRRPEHPHDRSRPERYGVRVGGVQRAALRETAEARDAAAEYFRLFMRGVGRSKRANIKRSTVQSQRFRGAKEACLGTNPLCAIRR